jgi:hypothetical protein
MRFNTLNCCEALPQMFLHVYQHAFSLKSIDLYIVYFFIYLDRRGRDRMVVGFNTICAISVYHR